MPEMQQDQKPKVVFWVANQVTITFHSKEPISADPRRIIESLDLEKFNRTLNTVFQLNLTSFAENDIPRLSSYLHYRDEDEREEQLESLLNRVIRSVVEEGSELFEKAKGLFKKEGEVAHKVEDNEHKADNINSLTGKYLFPTPDGEGTLVVTLFHVQSTASGQARGDISISGVIPITPDITPSVVSSINNNAPIFGFDPKDPNRPLAMPNWLSANTQGTDLVTHGCPVYPAYPLPDTQCSTSPGLWPFLLQIPNTLPDALQELESMTGNGVTVFVLDTLSRLGRIQASAQGVGNKNLLLLDLVESVTFKHYDLPDYLDLPNPTQVATGKDISGRLEGYDMPDHGLFVAGIVHDLAPKAQIECIRVLNDKGVGDGQMLIKVFQDIMKRMAPPSNGKRAGDLYQKPIVINMSLVTTPYDKEITDNRLPGVDPQSVRVTLESLLKIMAAQGVVFVASAGNDSDPRDTSMNMESDPGVGAHMGPRFPASFEDVIAVGALDKAGNPTQYSNYPGDDGVSTYGGDIPSPIAGDPKSPPPDCLTKANVTDAIIGVYTALSYPALSATDCEPDYPIPNANAWAYWSGTSFATPIISAVAARALELQLRGKLQGSVRDAIKFTSGGQKSHWGDNADLPRIEASQPCAPFESEDSQGQGNTESM
jgi:hypothetical protein